MTTNQPGKQAIVIDDQYTTYREFIQRVDAFSAYLVQECKIEVQDHIVFCMERSIDCIVALTAILNVGCVYIPIDPANSKQRIQHILEDAAPKLVITTTKLVEEVDFSGRNICLFDETELKAYAGVTVQANVEEDFIMYILYTSGTTGVPKGVAVNHKGAENLLSEVKEEWPLDKKVLQFASLGFDASVPEWAGCLASGGTLIMTEQRELTLGNELVKFINKHGINYIKMPAAVLSSLNHEESLPTVETIVTAGDACNQDLVDKWVDGRRFYNCYGPTENSIGSTRAECFKNTPVDIGVPVEDVEAYILDENLDLVADGEVGEIYLGGIQVSYGYINKPGLTAEKFLPNPFKGDGERMYKTGDLGKLLPNGRLDFVGRVDNQIKLNGYRIELDEIDVALKQVDAFSQAAITAIQNEKEQFLLAFYSAEATTTLNWTEIKETLKKLLPAYMIPHKFQQIDEFPLTVNGKIDSKKLKALYQEDTEAEDTQSEGENSLEKELENIWKKVLKVPEVKSTDSFFDLGAGSLDAAIVIAEIEGKYGISPSIADLYEHPEFNAFKKLTERFVQAFA